MKPCPDTGQKMKPCSFQAMAKHPETSNSSKVRLVYALIIHVLILGACMHTQVHTMYAIHADTRGGIRLSLHAHTQINDRTWAHTHSVYSISHMMRTHWK